MRSIYLFSLLGVVIVAPSSQSRLFTPTLHDGLKVPGDNTLTYCQEPSDYIVDIRYLNLSPNPPEKGKNLTVEAAGTTSQTIDVGTKLLVHVKLGYVTILRQEYDFCDVISAVNLSCPLDPGYRKVVKVAEIPGEIPPGKYTVTAEAYTQQHEREITCLQGSIVF